MDATIPRNKEERFTALSKGERDRLHALAVQIGIKQPDIALTVVEGVQCLIKRAHARRYLEASPAQHSFHINGDKRLILDNENPCGHCALPLEAVEHYCSGRLDPPIQSGGGIREVSRGIECMLDLSALDVSQLPDEHAPVILQKLQSCF